MLTASRNTPSNSAEIYEQMEAEAARIGFSEEFVERPLCVDLPGGDKKRNETLQLGVIAITRYSRLFDEIHPDVVHIFAEGRIIETGGPKLAYELEESGYERWVAADPVEAAVDADPFAGPLP